VLIDKYPDKVLEARAAKVQVSLNWPNGFALRLI
jgi:hypothetical protein